ncbi:MAG: BREX-1 system adenine-specific DNA-methyltransferase PglX [Actinomycetota bacterium]
METGPLKSFATWARTSLIREVTARIAVVLAPASPERVERPRAIEALEKAVTAAGGGDKGKFAVADRVAYTWFNRIIALRFMDASGYTGVGVVSPQAGVQAGQPEILAEAKRGNFETEVVGSKTREVVAGLLNGTRRSDDAQGEAYALMLADYCRYWNRAMPFMFEREGDFTELLIPANLLADDSVPSRAVMVLTKDVCQDVEVIGWLYQFYISERKDEVFAGFKKGKKAGADEIPAATQLFTPHWIVRYLVENSLGRLWMLNRPSSRLVDQMEYYIAPVGEEADCRKISGPEELTIIDPACGSGHMLTYAFDVLYSIYEEEGYSPAEIPSLILANNLYGVEIDPRAGALAAFALTMKARARQRTFFSKQVEPSVCVLEPIRFMLDEIDFLLTQGGDRDAELSFWNQFAGADTLGSLIQPDPNLTVRLSQHLNTLDDGGDMLKADSIERAGRVATQAQYLASQYAVAVANPPYMGSKNMSAALAEQLAHVFPEARSDLYAGFIDRCHSLVHDRGFVAMITMQSWTFQTSFRAFRKSLLRANPIVGLIGLGAGAFDSFGGEVVNTCAFVTSRNGSHASTGAFYRMEMRGELAMAAEFRAARDNGKMASIASSEFESFPNSVIAYWLTPTQANRLSHDTSLSVAADARVGLQTGDNDRFLRAWWEVSFSTTSMSSFADDAPRWLPYSKGGPFRKWFGNMDLVVDWLEDGRPIKNNRDASGKLRARPQNQAYYGRPAVEWSDIGQPILGARLREAGAMFDVVSMSLFSRADDESELLAYLAYLNSSIADLFIKAVAPGLHANTGYVSLLPWRAPAARSCVAERAKLCVEIARRDWRRRETASEFDRPELVAAAGERSIADAAQAALERLAKDAETMALAETANNEEFIALFDLWGEVKADVGPADVTLDRPTVASLVTDLVSYAVGCMFGRYSLDESGLILADQAATLQEYFAKAPDPTFAPDKDNVIPIIDGDWFEDDIVARFRSFVRVVFGEQHFEENLRFIADSLGVKDIRDYLVKSFYRDHVQRYKKRPIYWLFSSPKGSFNALIYMHRYTPSTVSTVLNEYLREFRAKLSSSLQQQVRLAAGGGTPRQQAAAQKEADRLRKVLLELEGYEHDVLYPLASRQLAIDLDDGVKANYPKFGAALKKIPGLEASSE